MKIKIAFITGVLVAFVGCIVDYNDNLFHSSYINGGRPPIQWFQIQIIIGEIIALVSGLMLHYKKTKCT